jgi:methyltransferase-like protein
MEQIAAAISSRTVHLQSWERLDQLSAEECFDFILFSGALTRQSGEVQNQLWRVCQDHLANNGVACIAYSTLPGAHFQRMTAEIVQAHCQRFTDCRQVAQQARLLMKFLATSTAPETPYGAALRSELQRLNLLDDETLYDMYVGRPDEPIWFHQFMETAHQHGLQYAGELNFASMFTGNLPAATANLIESAASDILTIEQYMDFLRNRESRQTILCRKGVELNRALTPERIGEMYIASSMQPARANGNFGDELHFVVPNSKTTVRASESIVAAALVHLHERWPNAVHMPRLFYESRQKLSASRVEASSEITQKSAELSSAILQLALRGVIELHAFPTSFDTRVSKQPRASAYARLEAKTHSKVTNLRGESVQLDEFARRLLTLLDGQKDRGHLLSAIMRDVRSGELVLQRDGDSADRRGSDELFVAAAVDACLSKLGRAALLIAPQDNDKAV